MSLGGIFTKIAESFSAKVYGCLLREYIFSPTFFPSDSKILEVDFSNVKNLVPH